MTRGVVKNGDRKGSILPSIFYALAALIFWMGVSLEVEASSCSKKIIDFIKLHELKKKDRQFLKKWSDSVKSLQKKEDLIDQNLFWLQTFLNEKVSSVGVGFALEQLMNFKPNPSDKTYDLVFRLLERSVSRQEGSVRLDAMTSEFLGDLFAKNPDSISEFLSRWSEAPIPRLEAIVWSIVLDAIDWSFHSDPARKFSGDELLFEQMKALPAHAKVSSDRVEAVNKMVWELQKLRTEYLAELNAHRLIELGEIDDAIGELVEMIDPTEGDKKFKLNRDYLDIDESLKDLEFLLSEFEGMSEIQKSFLNHIGSKALRNKETQSVIYTASQRAEELLFLYTQNPEIENPKNELKELRRFYETLDLLKYNEIMNLGQLGEISVLLDRMSKSDVNEADWEFLSSLIQDLAVYMKIRLKNLVGLADLNLSNDRNVILLRAYRSFSLQKNRFADLINQWAALAEKRGRDTEILEFNLEGKELMRLEKELAFYEHGLESLAGAESVGKWKENLSQLALDPAEVPKELIGMSLPRMREYWPKNNKALGFPYQKSIRSFIKLALSGQPIEAMEDGDGNINISSFVQYLQERSLVMQTEIEKSEYSVAELFVLVQRLRRVLDARNLMLQLVESVEVSSYVSEEVYQALLGGFPLKDQSLWLLFSSESLEDFKERIFKIKDLKKKGVQFNSFSYERMESMGSARFFEQIPWTVFEEGNPKK
ncbi:MAG: hypothetical protein ACO3LE_02160 [Bdellovibrionota bacterium]